MNDTITTPVADTTPVAPVADAPVADTTPVADAPKAKKVKADKPAKKGAKAKKADKPAKKAAEGQRGRPPIYVGPLAKAIQKVIREHGLTYGREHLRKEGVKVGDKVQKVKISLPTLGKLAKAAGIELQRGRPKVEEAA